MFANTYTLNTQGAFPGVGQHGVSVVRERHHDEAENGCKEER
jgi:hypothetical protein